MHQEWQDLLFYHWEYPIEVIQKTLPPGLSVDTFEGRAYLSVVAFTMKGLRPTGLPAVGSISNFLELNLRTYVRDGQNRAGVWFYSLDANSPLSVEIARRFFHLPYEHADMRKEMGAHGVRYCSTAKRDPAHKTYQYAVEASDLHAVKQATPGSLQHFWVERYHLFAYNSRRQQLNIGTIRHVPYEICEVQPLHAESRLMQLDGFDLPSAPLEKVYYSPGVKVKIVGFGRVNN